MDYTLSPIPEASQHSRAPLGARAERIQAAMEQIKGMTPNSKPLGRHCTDMRDLHSTQAMLRQAALHLGWVTTGMLKKLPGNERAGKQVFTVRTHRVGKLYAAIVVLKNSW